MGVLWRGKVGVGVGWGRGGEDLCQAVTWEDGCLLTNDDQGAAPIAAGGQGC